MIYSTTNDAVVLPFSYLFFSVCVLFQNIYVIYRQWPPRENTEVHLHAVEDQATISGQIVQVKPEGQLENTSLEWPVQGTQRLGNAPWLKTGDLMCRFIWQFTARECVSYCLLCFPVSGSCLSGCVEDGPGRTKPLHSSACLHSPGFGKH